MLILYVFLPTYLQKNFSGQMNNKTTSFLSEPSPTPLPTPALTPVTIIIPKLKIQAAVESVGLTLNDNMDVPKNASHAAWYQHGPSPAQEGNAVISAHFDTPSGRPALFHNLRKLVAGDEVEIVSINGVRSTFLVNYVDKIPHDIFPSDFVFKSKPGKNLNLITCSGIWDAKNETYVDRVVVYTTLKEEI